MLSLSKQSNFSLNLQPFLVVLKMLSFVCFCLDLDVMWGFV